MKEKTDLPADAANEAAQGVYAATRELNRRIADAAKLGLRTELTLSDTITLGYGAMYLVNAQVSLPIQSD